MTRQEPPGGPYTNGGDWWVAVEDCGYLEARRLVKGCAWAKVEYLGKEMATLMDCDEHEHEVDDPPCTIPGCRRVLAWHFVDLDA